MYSYCRSETNSRDSARTGTDLFSQQSAHADLGAVADGRQVVATFERQHQLAGRQLPQLLGHVTETCRPQKNRHHRHAAAGDKTAPEQTVSVCTVLHVNSSTTYFARY